MALQPDAASIRTFLDALFRHADPGTFLSLRAFDQRARNKPPLLIEGVKINGDFAPLAARAAAAAGKAANSREPAVFAPPVATFNNPTRARSQDLANGVALSVEIDEGDARRARATLEFLLGPATVVVASGGEWADPATGELHPKLHLHWRLTEPTRTPDDHGRLREARWLAAVLVGADRTAAPPPHPLRWPGSWNLKNAPGRLAGIVGGDADAEVELGDALERLAEAVEGAGLASRGGTGQHASGEPQAPVEDVAAALAFVPNADLHWTDWNRMGMAAWRATGGAEAGLDAWEAWSAKSGKHDADGCAERWAHYATSPPSKIGAGTIFFLARAAGWTGRGGPKPAGEPPPFAERAEAEAPPTQPKQEPSASAEAAAEPDKPAVWCRSGDWSEADIPVRPWIAPGHLLRGSVSIAAGMGSAGKSSLMVGWACALALGEPLGRFEPVQACRVINYNVEDDDDEQRRRFSAALRQFGRRPADLAGKVFRCGPRDVGTLIVRDPATGAISLTDAWKELERMAKDIRPDVVMLDPLVELHTAEENDNTALRQVIALLRAFAVRHNCAVVLIHHTRKGSAAGDMDAIRGAGSIVGAARVALTVAPMSEEEATGLDIAPDLRRRFFRVDSAKSNYAPVGEANWHELTEYQLDNGDLVAAAVPWTPPNQTERRTEGAAPEAMALVSAAAARGTEQGPYSPRLALDQPRSIAALMFKHGITRPAEQRAALQSMLSRGWTVGEFRDADGDKRKGLRSPEGYPETKWIGGSGE